MLRDKNMHFAGILMFLAAASISACANERNLIYISPSEVKELIEKRSIVAYIVLENGNMLIDQGMESTLYVKKEDVEEVKKLLNDCTECEFGTILF